MKPFQQLRLALDFTLSMKTSRNINEPARSLRPFFTITILLLKKAAHVRSALILTVALFSLQSARAQNLYIQGDALSDRNYNSDNGPTNSQLTLDFPITQAGILQNILTWGETSGQSISGIGENFELFVLRPLNTTNYQVVFATGYFTVANVGTNTFAVAGTPFGLQVGDVIAHYGRGIPFDNHDSGPSSVYIANNLPAPVVGTTITVPGATYPLYDDGGRNYAIQVQLLGQPFLVTTNSDNGPGSLRQAVLDANAFGSASTINFATNLSGQTILLTSGEMVLSNNVTIDASALTTGLTISGGNSTRIFYVNNGQTVSLLGLTLAGGNGAGGNDGYGGAINNFGNLSLTRCTLLGNSCFEGGAIEDEAGDNLALTNCTLSGNSASYGGAIASSAGTVSLTYCTLSGNASAGGGGGAIDNYNGGALTLTGCILAGDTDSSGTAPDLFMENGSLTANNCLIGDGMNSTLVNGVNGNKVGTTASPINPLLAPLGNYGGPTQTMPPLAGSPAIDAGIVIAGLTTDQRGYPRLSGAQVDIGAVEVNINTIVTTTADDGSAGSLRVVVANTTNTDLISFAPNLSGQTILLTNGQIEVSNNVTIDASALPGGIRINGNHQARIFLVDGGTAVVLDSLTITNGYSINDPSSGNGGGGIFNQGVLTLNNCTVSGNEAYAGGGGGIYRFGSGATTLNNCTVSGNQADNGGNGGGILDYFGAVTLNNCTLVGNSAEDGGAIECHGTGLTMNQCTVTQNYSTGTSADYSGGGGIDVLFSTPILTNCLVSGNAATTANGPDIWVEPGASISANNCLIGNGTSSTIVNTVNGNQVGTTGSPINALLAPLGNYGGPTPTMPPLPGSLAIDAGGTTTFTTDQRGYPRPVGLAADIGAVEVQSPASSAPMLKNITLSGSGGGGGTGRFQFMFTNAPDSDFTVLTATNLALPLTNWTVLGEVMQAAPGQYQFTDTGATNSPERFYRVVSP